MSKETHQLQKLNTAVILNPNDEYYTPSEVVARVMEIINGNFMYDPATTEWNAERLGIPVFDTIETDGLKQDWIAKCPNGDIWLNPPFDKKKEFIDKAIETIRNGFKGRICILTPDKAVTNKHLKDMPYVKHSLFIPIGRINFIDENLQQTKGNFFGSVITILGEHIEYQEGDYEKQVGVIRLPIIKKTINE